MDLSRAITLKDSDELIDTEINFKLCAGPGAGKTRFLINHIKNVIAKSTRLTKVKKIACITYTNIGVETITKRLDNAINEVEVSTIHSFLYKHVLKPYLWVLKEKYEIPLADIDGHDEIIPPHRILEEWGKKIPKQKYLVYKPETKKELMDLRWTIQSDGELKLKRKSYDLPISNKSLFEYKKLCWKTALISHDDVLFLSYEILKTNERILEILRAKFPYIFIDEFQDTSPIQSEIIKMIGEKETIIGVIGDWGQSIFAFQGADFHKFIDFSLDDMELYKIENNYRSIEEIIDILNHVRNESDFTQNSPGNKTGNPPRILIGSFFDAYKEAIKISGDQNVCTLSFKNDISNIMKFGYEDYFDSRNINEPLFRDGDRGWLITYTITAIEYGLQNKIKDAIKYMKKAYRKIENFNDKEALINLKRLINSYDEYKNGSIKDFYNNYLYDNPRVKPEITRGNINKYYESLEYRKIAVSVRINNDDSLHRTIHKSKGDEFNSVLLVIPPGENLEFLLNPDINRERHRLYYVALSRAIENLFINVPQLSEDNKKKLEDIRFEVVELNDKYFI